MKLALFTDGLLDQPDAKTAHGILRYADRDVVAVVDATFAGQLANDVIAYARRSTPVVATVGEAAALGADTLVIGVAPMGGHLTPEWRTVLLDAARAGLALEAGLPPGTGDFRSGLRAAACHLDRSKSHTNNAFCACNRFSASSHTALCGPSITSSVIS